ncbi:hypothetical protein BGX21_008442 [Mortierella sp. AD011]|nr:hypothetical protein BGX20_005839 [Mortierella sp. AD010]KAF9403876.1 hypothetical protein BGX21_008442 [Mortierella sp. AD011]
MFSLTSSRCTARRIGLLHESSSASARLLIRAHYGQLPVVVTHTASRAKHMATPPPPPSSSEPAPPSPHHTESQISIYDGPFSQTARRLKLFSVSSLAATIALCPFIFILDAGLSTGMRGGLAFAAVATSGSSTALVQWCLGPYVRKITIPNNTLSAANTPSTDSSQPESTNPEITVTRSTPVSFETLSFLGRKRITTVKVSDLEPSSAPFSTIRIRAGQQSVVRDDRGRILSDGNKLKKRLYLHRELTNEEPLRTIMAEIQQNQNLTPSTDAPAKLSKVSETAKDGSDSAHAGVKAPVTEGMSDRIEQLKRKASENAKKDH